MNCEDDATGGKENPVLFMPTFETLLNYTEQINNRRLTEDEKEHLYKYF